MTIEEANRSLQEMLAEQKVMHAKVEQMYRESREINRDKGTDTPIVSSGYTFNGNMSKERFVPMSVEEANRSLQEMLAEKKIMHAKVEQMHRESREINRDKGTDTPTVSSAYTFNGKI